MKLVNCYLPVFRLGYEISLHPDKYAEYSSLRDKCIALLKASALASELENCQSDCDSALFAVAVWLDEKILCSDLPYVARWRSSLLQTQLFQTSIGGELFFKQLDDIPSWNTSLYRLYLFCLLMGFHGKFTQQDKDMLNACIEKTKQCLPYEWRSWPNRGIIVSEERVIIESKNTLWKRISGIKQSFITIFVIIYGMVMSIGLIYFYGA